LRKLISYSHNREDVLIQRALSCVERGCYIDVGACVPCESSNTWALYERGWSGIAVEPLLRFFPEYDEAWRKTRPRDHVIAAAAGSVVGEMDFHFCTNLQMSTGITHIAEDLIHQGMQEVVRTVPVTTLDHLLMLYPGDVHLLSVDVEGMEEQALAGLNFNRYRPWLVVVERTNGVSWEQRLLTHGYDTVFDDGTSRFYLARERDYLKKWFCFPPHTLEYVSYRELALERRVKELEDRLNLPDLDREAHLFGDEKKNGHAH
jgi:FkbM family methyltransferase